MFPIFLPMKEPFSERCVAVRPLGVHPQFLAFFPLQFLAFLSVFPFFPKAFWGSSGKKNPSFLGRSPSSQGNTPWVAPACADCPGFLVVGSAPAPASTLASEPRNVPWASVLLYGPLDIAWICCPQLPTVAKKGT